MDLSTCLDTDRNLRKETYKLLVSLVVVKHTKICQILLKHSR